MYTSVYASPRVSANPVKETPTRVPSKTARKSVTICLSRSLCVTLRHADGVEFLNNRANLKINRKIQLRANSRAKFSLELAILCARSIQISAAV